MVASGVGPGGLGGFGPRRVRWRPDVPLRDRRRRRLPLRSARRHVRRRRRAAGGARGGAAATVRSAARTSRPSCTSSFDDAVQGRHEHGAVPLRRGVPHVSRQRRRAGYVARDVPAVPRRGHDRGRPGSVLVLAGVPHVRRARPGDPEPVPDVSRPRRRGARPRGEGAHPGRRRRRAAHPREGSRRRRRQRRSAGRPLRRRARAPHPLFGRNGNDLTLRVPVTFAEATLGADVKVPTLDGQVTVRIPPGTPSGKVMRVRGKGDATPTARAGGDLLVTVDVQVPDRAERRAARRGRDADASARRATRARRCSRHTDDPGRRNPMEADARALYVISVAAELAGMHPQTLRIYERKGLIEPARTSGRSRRYSERDIELLRRIQELSNEGVSLAGVQRILALEDELAAARRRIAELEAALDALREEMERAHRECSQGVPARARSAALRHRRAIRDAEGDDSKGPHAPRPQPIHPQDPRGARRRAGARARRRQHRGVARCTSCARCSTSPKASSPGVLERIGVDLASLRRRVDEELEPPAARQRRDRARRAARDRGVPPARRGRQGARAARRRVPLDRARPARDDRT